MEGEETPIPPYAEDSLDILSEVIPDDQSGIDEADAREALVDEGFTRADAVDALELLEMRGYVYRVDSEVRITD
ncbi:hypothetical protein [Haloarchaeobius sp. HME9146]|uniref:hypothetical protein n=1 Tax=Haloarchaeobius sp. HME9146 TaxID=2978732 RepID=UPI0021C231B0|nr:hypothetical protein [Haloarchaeobius sp. HME9146]MCT9095692.1 hypothetical protein [Haloarchaeobius sp. HME9146]